MPPSTKTNREIEQHLPHARRPQKRGVRQSEQRFHQMLDALPAAIYTTDAEGRLTYFNRAAVEFSGRVPELGTDQWCVSWRLYRADGAPMAHDQCPMAIALKEGRAVQGVEAIAERPDGTRIWFEPHPTPLWDSNGHIVGGINMLLDITERKRAEEALHSAQQELSDFVENGSIGMHWVGPDGVILWANRNELEMLGYTREEYVGHHIANFHTDPPAVKDTLQRLTCGETLHEYPTRLRCKDGSVRDVLINSNVRWQDGKFIHTRCFTRDITSQKQADVALRQSEERFRSIAEALKESDRRKDEFLATLAHELRNPLAPLRNGLQILQLAGDQPETIEQMRPMMERQLGQMVRMIDDLLDLSRISRGKVELRKERMQLTTVLQHAIEMARPAINAAGHELVISAPSEAIFVHADATRLTQVFANLLNNAAKFTDRGGRVELVVQRDDNHAVVSVRDNGVGIPADALPRVFDMFSQVDQSLERTRGGLGIGLSLVRGLVEMHGGSVAALSEGHAKGSEFIVRLPVTLSVVGDSAPAAEPIRNVLRRRILVVDDNVDAATTLALMLELMGNDAQSANSAHAALEIAETFRPDAVVLDIGMPNVNGYEAARRIRQRPWGKNVTLVALTGWGQERDRQLAHEAGFDAHLMKPAAPDEIEKLLQSRKTASA